MSRDELARTGFLLALSLGLGLWGIPWCLPSKERLEKVLPPGLDSPSFREHLLFTWNELYSKLGRDILLNPESFSPGFEEKTTVEPGWETPPAVMVNPARSFYLRSGHEDEPDILTALSRIKPHRLELNPRIYFYGGAYMYLLGGWIVLLSAVTPAHLTPSLAYYLSHPEQMARIYLLGRLFSAAVYVLGCLLIYLIGKRFWDERAGFWAALFFAVSPGVVIQAHYMKPHLLGSLFIMGAFWLCAKILQGGEKRLWMWAGAMVGLAAGSAVYMWNSAVILLFTFCLRIISEDKAPAAEIKNFLKSLTAAIFMFFLTNPYLIYEFETSRKALKIVSGFSAMDPHFIWKFILIGFPKAVTLPIAAWTLWGLFSRNQPKNPVKLLALGVFLFYLASAFIFQSADKLDSVRQFPAVFLGALLAGSKISGLRSSFLVLAAASAAYGFLNCAVLDYNLYRDRPGFSTRDEAGRWMEREISAGSELGLLRLPQPSNSPYFQWNRYRLRFIEPKVLARWSDPKSLPQYLILTCPTYDDRPMVRNILDSHYEKLKTFEPYSLLWIAPPIGESYGNPLVEIYRKNET